MSICKCNKCVCGMYVYVNVYMCVCIMYVSVYVQCMYVCIFILEHSFIRAMVKKAWVWQGHDL